MLWCLPFFHVPPFYKNALESLYLSYRAVDDPLSSKYVSSRRRSITRLVGVSLFDLCLIQDVVSFISINIYISCRFRLRTLQRGRLRSAAPFGLVFRFDYFRGVCLSRRRISAVALVSRQAHATVAKVIYYILFGFVGWFWDRQLFRFEKRHRLDFDVKIC